MAFFGKDSDSPQTIQELRSALPRPGRVEWLGLRPTRRAEVQRLPEVQVLENIGLLGDHGKTPETRLSGSGKRQVTLVQAEHLPVIAALAGLEVVTPELLRRNVVVSGISLLALKDRRFQLGQVILEGTGECHPCSRMEENLGPGGYNAVRGHGGITARVIQGGVVRLGDSVTVIPKDTP